MKLKKITYKKTIKIKEKSKSHCADLKKQQPYELNAVPGQGCLSITLNKILNLKKYIMKIIYMNSKQDQCMRNLNLITCISKILEFKS